MTCGRATDNLGPVERFLRPVPPALRFGLWQQSLAVSIPGGGDAHTVGDVAPTARHPLSRPERPRCLKNPGLMQSIHGLE